MHDAAEMMKDPKRLWGVGEVLRLSLPTAMGMINTTLMQFVDGLMVAHIRPDGAAALSAQMSAGILSFAPQALAMGALSVVNTFVAQNFGADRPERCGQYTWSGLYLAALWALLVLPLGVGAPALFAALGHAPPVQAMEVVYFRYMIAAQLAFVGGRVLESFFYGTHRPTVVYLVSLGINALNVAGDYALIFGHWGLPAMGLEGAAIATVVSQAVGLIALGAVFLASPAARRFDTRGQAAPRPAQMVSLLRIGWPAGLQMSLDVLGWALCITILVGGIRTIGGVPSPEASTIHLAASTVAMKYMQLAFMPTIGISIAVTALVGKYIGARQLHLVNRRVHAALALGVLYMGLCGLVFLLWRQPLLRLFLTMEARAGSGPPALTEQVIRVGSGVMVVAAFFQVFDAVGIIFIGALRGAGETLWPMATSIVLIVTLLLGAGALVRAVFPASESLGVWIACAGYVVLLGLVMFARFQAGKWRSIDLLKQA